MEPRFLTQGFAPADDFATVCRFLQTSGFTEDAVCQRLGIDNLSKILSYLSRDRQEREAALGPLDALRVLATLFLNGWLTPASEIDAVIPLPVRGAMEATGLLDRNGDGFVSPVMLYPLQQIFIASDRLVEMDGADASVGPDFVYFAIQHKTRTFLSLLPDDPCEAFLELGTGCGAAAILAAKKNARHVWATDLTERSCLFTRFNCLLNQVSNVETLAGDLFAPVKDRQFDCVVIHPPYDMGPDQSFVFSDGGEDGERLLRRTISELPDYLNPGGRFYCHAIVADHENASYEQRVRGWLGDRQENFDVLLVVREHVAPEEYAAESVALGGGSSRQLASWKSFFKTIGVKELLYGYLVIQRKSAQRLEFTIRREIGPETAWRDVSWLLDWEATPCSELLGCAVKAIDGTELAVRHRIQDGELNPVHYAFQTVRPFRTNLECRAWVAYFVTLCDGRKSGRDHYEFLLQKGAIPADSTPEYIGQAIKTLVSAGVLQVE